MKLRSLALVLVLTLASACETAKPPQEAAGAQAMVAAADPRAVDAGLAMLRQGGSATDAAIATIAVLGLVEPQSAGVGGGGFLVAFDKAHEKVSAYDGREAAPAAASAHYFFGPDGKPLPFFQAVASGRSTGAPTLYAMLKLAHEDSGKLPWASLFAPAIKMAEEGFIVSPRMHDSIAAMGKFGPDYVALKLDPAARAYLFLPDGSPLPAGFVRKNPEYAATLRALAAQGPRALQEGAIAAAIVKATQQAPRPGVLTLADLANVQVRRQEALCGAYRSFKVCGAPPPTSGGVTVIDILGLFERARPKPQGPANPDDWAAFLWASRIAYTDRNYYVADDRVVPSPTKGLIDPRYLDTRAPLIDLAKAAPAVIAPGDPAKITGEASLLGAWGAPAAKPEAGTTHMSIVDAQGNAIAMTASIEAPFGAERMAAGFFLNNQLTDFSIDPQLNGKPVANAPAANKKPRSSMAPTLIFDKRGNLYAAIGSPGGSSIIAYVAKTIIGVVDWKLTMQAAIEQPNVVAASETVRVEKERFPDALNTALAARGWKLAPSDSEISGLHGILVTSHGLEGGADSRREGVARLASAPAGAAN